MKHFIFSTFAVISAVALMASCSKSQPENVAEQIASIKSPIVFGAGGNGFSAESATKASEVTALSSFYASATTGAAGSEASVWNSVSFSKSGTDYTGGKFWPNADPKYNFMGSNLPITFDAAGSTVAATTETDVVCAYFPYVAASYKAKNELAFEHIFARVTDVTVNAVSGYTMSNISIKITPKTSGTYNICTGAGKTDGTGWSSTMVGSATEIANTTPGTKSNDLYLVPGSYTLTASWKASRNGYEETISNKVVDVNIVGGKKNIITATLGGNAEEIVFTVSVAPWGTNNIDAGTFPIN